MCRRRTTLPAVRDNYTEHTVERQMSDKGGLVVLVCLAYQSLVYVARPPADADELGVGDLVGLYAARLHHGQDLFRLVPVVASPETDKDK